MDVDSTCEDWQNNNMSPHSTTERRSFRAKYKQPIVLQPEVTCTRRHVTFTHNVIISIDTVFITQDHSREVPRLLHDISSKYWLCMRVSRALRHRHKDDVM